MWLKDKPRVDLAPWSRYFTGEAGEAIALHMPDSILTALLFCLGYWFEETQHKATLLNAFRAAS